MYSYIRGCIYPYVSVAFNDLLMRPDRRKNMCSWTQRVYNPPPPKKTPKSAQAIFSAGYFHWISAFFPRSQRWFALISKPLNSSGWLLCTLLNTTCFPNIHEYIKQQILFLKNSSSILCNPLGKIKADFYSDWEAAGTYAGDQAVC